jgi:hypothetical protein
MLCRQNASSGALDEERRDFLASSAASVALVTTGAKGAATRAFDDEAYGQAIVINGQGSVVIPDAEHGASLIGECSDRVLTRSFEAWVSSTEQCAPQRDRSRDRPPIWRIHHLQ